ncbi:MAG: 6-carboxytetrahydropterin synthase [Candidatus Zixiibacteriota bacterium]
MPPPYLTISKRFEFSASHRCYRPEWSDEQNLTVFGMEARGLYGHGHNYEVDFVFNGPIDALTGMMINFVAIKQRIKPILDQRYDHKYLNADTPPFNAVVPTAENLAVQLLKDVHPLFEQEKSHPVACHLLQSPTSETTAYADGRVERHIWLEFSATRTTCSPHLSEPENRQLFGIAASPSGHGHNYRLRITLAGEVHPEHGMIITDRESRKELAALQAELDHRNLNKDLPALRGLPITTEILARFVWERLKSSLPVCRVRLYEKSDFFVEYRDQNEFSMGIQRDFYAAHRLHNPRLSNEENRRIFQLCNNPQGHGHQYRVECTIAGQLDERSGILFPLDRLIQGVESAVESWNYKHLDLETEDFVTQPSTGENIVWTLWPRISAAIDRPLYRLRLWETPSNRFTLRESVYQHELMNET